MSLKTLILGSAVVIALTACQTPENDDDESEGYGYEPSYNEAYVSEVAGDVQKATDFLVGNTVHIYDEFYEETDFITYFSPDGYFYEWAPDEEEMYQGKWGFKTSGWRSEICFGYSEYNAVDGSDWLCESLTSWIADSYERVKGDPFQLARREAVPFRMSYYNEYDFNKLARFVKIPPFTLRYLETAYSVDDDYQAAEE